MYAIIDVETTGLSPHRALGDATATVKLFELLLSIDPAITGISLKGLNSNLSNEKIKELPQKPGVYYFFNKQGDIIYIGKSINIRNRVLSHISNNTSKKETKPFSTGHSLEQYLPMGFIRIRIQMDTCALELIRTMEKISH